MTDDYDYERLKKEMSIGTQEKINKYCIFENVHISRHSMKERIEYLEEKLRFNREMLREGDSKKGKIYYNEIKMIKNILIPLKKGYSERPRSIN